MITLAPLEPENIFLDQKIEVKIGDFGLAKKVGVNLVMSQMTGTLLWMAPGWWRGARIIRRVSTCTRSG